MHARALNVALGLGEGPPPAQLLVASAILALLQQASKEQPLLLLLLIVDDLPWLDRASALVLGMVACRLAAFRWLSWPRPGRVNPASSTRATCLDRLSRCREPFQRAIQHGREGGAVTSAIEALFLLG